MFGRYRDHLSGDDLLELLDLDDSFYDDHERPLFSGRFLGVLVGCSALLGLVAGAVLQGYLS